MINGIVSLVLARMGKAFLLAGKDTFEAKNPLHPPKAAVERFLNGGQAIDLEHE